MKKQLVRKRSVHCKYITPAILLASGWAPLVAEAQNIVARLWGCQYATPYRNPNGPASLKRYLAYALRTAAGDGVPCTWPLAKIGTTTYGTTDSPYLCVPITYIMHSSSNRNRSDCKVTIYGQPALSQLEDGAAAFPGIESSVLLYNALLAECSGNEGFAVESEWGSRGAANSLSGLRLGRIVLALATEELNRASASGEKRTRGERVDAGELSAEQRRVLQNHMGIMKEALRQIKAEQAEQSKNGTLSLEHAAGGSGDESLIDSMGAPR